MNLEPKYKNLALEKVRIYHERRGDTVQSFGLGQFDVVYCSGIFDFTKRDGRIPPDAICGGTGFDLTTVLPPEIDSIEPHLSFGFTTRGCIRNCKFCVVPRKEGKIRVVGDLLSLWDGKARDVVLFDNNILAVPDHFALVCEQARKHKLRLDFNQGLDHRLLTPEIIDLMKSISHHEYRFAFDHPSLIGSVDSAIALLQTHGIQRATWYVLVGFDTTFEQDLDRLNYLRGQHQAVYVQRFIGKGKKLGKEYIVLANWANAHRMFQALTLQQYIRLPRNKGYKKYMMELGIYTEHTDVLGGNIRAASNVSTGR